MCGELVTLGQVLLRVLWFSPVNDTYHFTDVIFSSICYPNYEEWAGKTSISLKTISPPTIKDSKRSLNFQVFYKKKLSP